jgi:hypothetical protein
MLLTSALRLAQQHGCAAVVREAEALLAAPPPLPAQLAAAARHAFVGRRDELSTLESVDEGLVLVAGEPGVGKSALVAARAVAAHRDGAWVLYGRCDEELAVPYRPFVEGLAQLVDNLSDEALDAVGDRHLAELVRLAPALRDRRPSLPSPQATDPETERYLLMNAVVATFLEAARRARVVFIVDDLQVADKPTLLLLRHVVSTIGSSAITVLGTYRHTDLGADAPFTDVLPVLRSQPNVRHIVIEGLTIDELAELTDVRDLAEALHRETGGNALFATELLRQLHDTDGDLDSVTVPDELRGLMRRRVAHLGDDVRTVLVTASVIGQEFDLPLLASTLDDDADHVLDLLEAAERAALITTIAPERFTFAHALVQHALYEELPTTRRVRLHRVVAQSIESLGEAHARVTELARHWSEGALAPADLEIAVTAATAAGDRALSTLAPDEAVRWYDQALGLQQRLAGVEPRARCDLLLRLADAKLRAGREDFRDSRRDAAGLALDLGDAELIARAAFIDQERGAPQADVETVSLLQAALDKLGDGDSSTRARLLARVAWETMFVDPEAADRTVAASMAMARRLDDRKTLADVLPYSWVSAPRARRNPDWYATHQRDEIEALAMAREIGDPTVVMKAARWAAQRGWTVGDVDVVDEMIDLVEHLAEEIGRPDLRVNSLNDRAQREIIRGNLAAAEQLLDEARQVASSVHVPDAELMYWSALGSIRWHQGRQREVAERVAELAASNPDIQILRLPVALGPIATLEDLSAVVASLPDDNAWLVSAVIVADIVARRSDVAAASLLYDELSPSSGLFSYGGPLSRGAVDHALGVLARTLGITEDADAHFAAAAAMHERMRAPFFLARTWLEWSALLIERAADGDLDRARELLTAARDVSRDHGYAQIERRADRALASIS